MNKLYRWSLMAIVLFILAITVYLYALGKWTEAIAFSGVTSVILWFMTRIIEKANQTSVEPDDQIEDEPK